MNPVVIDTHCHIHDPEFADTYEKPVSQIIQEAKDAGVHTFICVGTSADSSKKAVTFAKEWGVYASLALHPHEVAEKSENVVKTEFADVQQLAGEKHPQVVAIGECGLDYYYHSEEMVQKAQQDLFRKHLDLAVVHDLSLIFHIRNAFDDFFAIIDEYMQAGHTLRGVVHSFTGHKKELDGCLQRGFYIGLNGIMTFTRDEKQLEAAKLVPAERLVLETDAPFLTPKPYRGKMCELSHILLTASFLSDLRGETIESLAAYTTANAKLLFRL